MKRFATIFCALVLPLVGVCACQPTPENVVVVNKANGELEKKIHVTPQPTEPEATVVSVQHINRLEKGKDERVTITIDADVILPSVDKYPVFRIEPDDFDIDFVKHAVDVLFKGNTPYEPRRGQLTKDEIAAKILELQQALADPENSRSDGLSSGDPETVKEVTKMFQQRIRNYQELYEDAPQEYIPTEAVFEFKPATYYMDQAMVKENMEEWRDDPDEEAQELIHQYEHEQQITMDTQLDNGSYISLGATNYRSDKDHWSYFGYTKAKELDHLFRPKVYNQDKLVECTLSEDEAMAIMQSALERMGITDMVMTGVHPHWKLSDPKDFNSEKLYYSYSAIFQREYYGIQTRNELRGLHPEHRYGPWFAPETIEMRVFGNEVASLSWKNPVKVVKVENENVELLPFEEVLDRFYQQMGVEYTLAKLSHYSPENRDYDEVIANMEDAEIKIYKIELCLMRVPIRNEADAFRMIPVWKFYGGETVDLKDPTIRCFPNEQNYDYLTINAIDGSIINQRGY